MVTIHIHAQSMLKVQNDLATDVESIQTGWKHHMQTVLSYSIWWMTSM